jgi:cytochrome P450
VVWLDAHQMYAVARYAGTRAVLGDPGTYCSGRGVALNDTVNALAAGRNVLMTDGKLHEHLRRFSPAISPPERCARSRTASSRRPRSSWPRW